jgi:glutathionylspermidine synthase
VGLPWRCGSSLPSATFANLTRRAIFDCCKWHLQVGDLPVLCPFPLVLSPETWLDLCRMSENLARESLAAEQELLTRPDLYRLLGLPAELRSGFTAAKATAGPRVIRFDFHWTSEGWRISEANADVASGYIEASGFTHLFAAHYPDVRATGDPAGALASALVRAADGGAIGLMHLPQYTEDRQIVLYLARRLEERQARTSLLSPGQVHWRDGRALATPNEAAGALGAILRFYPAEWLPRLPSAARWRTFFAGGQTPICNPGSAVLTQSKRFPLAWDQLRTPLATWRALLPPTCSPTDVPRQVETEWVWKPALGHEGNSVAVAGAVEPDEWKRITLAARRQPAQWVAQRRFDIVPLPTPEGTYYPCVGVYIIDGHVAGAYGRLSQQPLIDQFAREIAVLVPE